MKGYSERKQPAKGPTPPLGGVELSGNPEEFLEAETFSPVEHPDNSDGDWDGDNPMMGPELGAMPYCPDMRNREGGNSTNPTPGMPGA